MSVTYLTTEQVAERLHREAYSVRALIASGRLRASKDGRRWLVAEADLADYLDAQSTRPRKRRNRAVA